MSQPCARPGRAPPRRRRPASRPPGAQSVAEMRTEMGLCLGPGRAHRVEDLERVAQAVGQRAAVLVGALVGERREEAAPAGSRGRSAARAGRSRPRRPWRRRATKSVAHLVHVGARHLARHLAVRQVGQRARRAMMRPVALGQRLVDRLPTCAGSTPCGRRGRAACRCLAALCCVHEVDDAPPRRDVLGLVHAGAARA